MEPRTYCKTFTLKNGTKITLRAIRADDAERVRRAFSELDPRSIYTRFFSAKTALTNAELKDATEIDFDRAVAVVAVLEADPDVIIGGGRYVRLRGPKDVQAEVAFTVEEDYQGLGLASLILRVLAETARRSGVKAFVAEVLPSNTAMLHVFRNSGLPETAHLAEGVMHIALDLTQDELTAE